LERITPAGARIYEILHHPEAFTVQTIAAAEHIKGRHHAKVVMVKIRGAALNDNASGKPSRRSSKA
jgi:hypothetical protein